MWETVLKPPKPSAPTIGRKSYLAPVYLAAQGSAADSSPFPHCPNEASMWDAPSQ